MRFLVFSHTRHPHPNSNGPSSPHASEHLDVALHDLSQTRRKNRLKKLKADEARLGAIENKKFRPYRGSSLFKPARTITSVQIDIDTLDIDTLDDRLPKRLRGKSRKNRSMAKARLRGKSRPTVGSRNKANGLQRGSGTQLFHHAIGFDTLQQDDYDEGADDGPDFGPWSGAKPPRTLPSASPRLDQPAFPAVHSKPSGEYKIDTTGGGFVNGTAICGAHSNIRLLVTCTQFFVRCER